MPDMKDIDTTRPPANDSGGSVLSFTEVHRLTGYRRATKQLSVLHIRGFTRAYINRDGVVVLERPHYEAVAGGEVAPGHKKANLAFFNRRAA